MTLAALQVGTQAAALVAAVLVGGGLALAVVALIMRVRTKQRTLAQILDDTMGKAEVPVEVITESPEHGELSALTVRIAGIFGRIDTHGALEQRLERLMSIDGVGPITALTWALEVADPHRFSSVADAVSYCGLTAAFRSSAGKQQRGPISKQRNAWLQTALIEAAKLAPRWNPQLAALHAQQRERGHANRATLQVARKLVAYLLAVDKNGQPFQVRTPPPPPKAKPRKRKQPAALASAA